MKARTTILCIAIIFCQICFVFDSRAKEEPLTADQIMVKVEKKYSVPGFVAKFIQMSTLKVMGISDVAEGKIFVKRPGMMRWEYEKPDKQIVVTDGESLWIYRPQDNQVMVGKAPEFFGAGKGASFLSDISIIRHNFSVTIKNNTDKYFVLKLLPNEKRGDVSYVYLYVSRTTFEIAKIGIYNLYDDETELELIDSKFVNNPDSVFSFKIPKGVEVLKIGE
ncbi:MAG: outer membrane lipoprotein carrier protein LolA [Desulfobacterium sp.]|nr:outer membrane lipoprotein carrier protein LolA [Desulfobacterium sp.]MBU3946781.1 outer membrane lipoprotein carrier protein LolA [Pseudomonadota bacterium]MBU4009173.1 outer membrane lipoprotein carrier protein LolA [Pseudomonadota bacterium]MBU4035276.1 outer membrane lipoprotein carrier protein LolA [Pseudomonadota bacterium]